MPEFDFSIPRLGKANIKSPIKMSTTYGDRRANYVRDDEFILYDIDAEPEGPSRTYRRSELLEKAGPRELIYFAPSHVHAGVVTCGGLCPGLNNVIRAIVRCLWYRYGVRRITGIRNGYRGFLPDYELAPISLTPEFVDDIHGRGGTVLGSSRGGSDVSVIADSIQRMNLNLLFTIGGDGTQRGSLAIAEELESRGQQIAVIGIPKTIDNDLAFIQRSFGFETAVSKAIEAVSSAHIEAHDAINGIGLVKVMGRESGFIATHTALASNDVNFVLVPEIPFELEGDEGLFMHLEKRLTERDHAVILVAEGAGQNLLQGSDQTDASGNKVLPTIGIYLRDLIADYFKRKKMEVNLKYIDPSYMIRSMPANPNDSIYCTRLGNHAVHAAMSGRTRMLISLVHDTFVHIPTELAVSRRNVIDPESDLWRDVLETTGQPVVMRSS